jgi:hypothetical protein
MMDYVN